jgi:hypothetical protein
MITDISRNSNHFWGWKSQDGCLFVRENQIRAAWVPDDSMHVQASWRFGAQIVPRQVDDTSTFRTPAVHARLASANYQLVTLRREFKRGNWVEVD